MMRKIHHAISPCMAHMVTACHMPGGVRTLLGDDTSPFRTVCELLPTVHTPLRTVCAVCQQYGVRTFFGDDTSYMVHEGHDGGKEPSRPLCIRQAEVHVFTASHMHKGTTHTLRR